MRTKVSLVIRQYKKSGFFEKDLEKAHNMVDLEFLMAVREIKGLRKSVDLLDLQVHIKN